MSDVFDVTVKFKDSVFEVDPYNRTVPKAGTIPPAQATVKWTLTESDGFEFPQKPTDSADAIEFKPGSGPVDPTYTKSALEWTVTYLAPPAPVRWKYTVRVKNKSTGAIIGFDPEVDNVRPGPGPIPEPEEEKEKKEKKAEKDTAD